MLYYKDISVAKWQFGRGCRNSWQVAKLARPTFHRRFLYIHRLYNSVRRKPFAKPICQSCQLAMQLPSRNQVFYVAIVSSAKVMCSLYRRIFDAAVFVTTERCPVNA